MKLKILLCFSFFLFTLSACSISSSVKENVPQENTLTKTPALEASTPINKVISGKLKIACPIGLVCDENFDYRAYEYEDAESDIYLSFEPKIVDHYTLQGFKDYFKYVNVQLRLLGSTQNKYQYFQDRTPITNIEFLSYENGVLKGEINFIIDYLTTVTSGECINDDIEGPCYKDNKANIPYSIEFQFFVPE